MKSAAPCRTMVGVPLLAAALTLAGCWTAPVANVQPEGEARLIQGGITVASFKAPAVVESLEPSTRTIVMRRLGTTAASIYKLGPGVENISSLKAGDVVEATLVQELTVYVLRDGEAPGAGGVPEKITADARVLSVDPSYRLLTLQYPNGQNETFKIPLDVRLKEMAAGDSVAIRPIEAVSLRQQR